MNTINQEDARNFLENAKKGDEKILRTLAVAYYEGNGIKQDYAKAFECYNIAAKLGDEIAQCDLAYLYLTGQGTQKDAKQAIFWYTKSAEKGFSDAQVELGVLYHNGVEVGQDYEKSLYWYQKAAEQGNAHAQENLAYMAMNGEGMSPDYPKAIELFKKAAAKGMIGAQYALGIIYLRDKWVERDLIMANYWLKKAADQGHEKAVEALKQVKNKFDSVPSIVEEEDSDEYENDSFDYQSCLQSIVSDENIFTKEEAMACFCIGADIIKYQDNSLVPPGDFLFSDNEDFMIYKDLMMYAVYLLGIKSESSWPQIYADAEHPDMLATATNQLSLLSDKKKTCASVFLRTLVGSNADDEKFGERVLKYHNYCIEYGLREIVDAGIAQRLSMKMTLFNGYDYMRESFAEYLDLDNHKDTFEDDEEFDPEYVFDEEIEDEDLEDEELLDNDKEESEETLDACIDDLYQRARNDDVDALNELGKIYIEGNLVGEDYEKAVEFFQQAAELGHIVAQYHLGQCYYYGFGVPRNVSEGLRWIKKAAEQGYFEAQTDLANNYYNGDYIPQDFEEAAKWYLAAAEQGDKFAQGRIGECYLQGEGVPFDLIKAKDWFKKSEDEKYKAVIEKLEHFHSLSLDKIIEPSELDLLIETSWLKSRKTEFHEWKLNRIILTQEKTILEQICSPLEEGTYVFSEKDEYIEDVETGKRYYIEDSTIGIDPERTVIPSKDTFVFQEFYPVLPLEVKTIRKGDKNGYMFEIIKIR